MPSKYWTLEFYYTPVDENGYLKDRLVIRTKVFRSINQIFDTYIVDKVPFYKKRKTPNHEWPDSIAKRLKYTYQKIESLRRSPEWHNAVDKYTDDPNIRNRLKMDHTGRKSKGTAYTNYEIK